MVQNILVREADNLHVRRSVRQLQLKKKSGGRRILACELPDENIITVGAEDFLALKYCASQVSLVKEPADSSDEV